MEKVIVKLRKSGNSVVITIPKPVLDDLFWRDGDYVALSTKEGKSSLTLAKILIAEKILFSEEAEKFSSLSKSKWENVSPKKLRINSRNLEKHSNNEKNE